MPPRVGVRRRSRGRRAAAAAPPRPFRPIHRRAGRSCQAGALGVEELEAASAARVVAGRRAPRRHPARWRCSCSSRSSPRPVCGKSLSRSRPQRHRIDQKKVACCCRPRTCTASGCPASAAGHAPSGRNTPMYTWFGKRTGVVSAQRQARRRKHAVHGLDVVEDARQRGVQRRGSRPRKSSRPCPAGPCFAAAPCCRAPVRLSTARLRACSDRLYGAHLVQEPRPLVAPRCCCSVPLSAD